MPTPYKENDNPYQPPGPIHEDVTAGRALDAERTPYGLMVIWTVLFSLNLIIPVLFGAPMIQQHGAIGMLAAVMLFWIGGGVVCLRARQAAVRMMFGASILAATQLLPIIQMIAGMLALKLTQQAGLIGDAPDHTPFPLITSELGGFVMTCIVGGMLVTLVAGLALLSALIFPDQRNPSAAKVSRR